MKKGILLSIFFFAISFFALAQAPCNQVAFTQSFIGNTATFVSTMPAGYNITNYNWSFGDGGTSNVANPTHTYANFGWYNACLVVSGTYNNQYVSCTYCDSVNVPNNVPCNASFIYTPSGNTVSFTNTATGPGVITNYAWNFGDGNQSNLPNPTHTYANSGWYNACLTIYGIDNGITYTCTWCDSILVQVGGGNPCNQISYSTNMVGNAVSFTANYPVGFVPAIYNWSFGDGGTSNVANPTHTYANFGWYNACLVVSGTYNNQYVSCTYCDSVYVPNNVPCNASFIYTPSGNTVSFTNTATGPGVITNYAWNFGDGNQSNLPNPTHTYANSGWYNACLTIYGIDNGITYTCTWCDSILVQVGGGNPCNQITFANLIAGNNVNFSVVLPGGFNATNYSWMFGDGGTSNLPNPLHTYNNTGWYNACVVVSGTYNNTPVSCTLCDSIFVLNATSIKDIENNLIIVYPNPANQFIEIPLYNSQEAILKIYDVIGKMISQTLIQSNNKTYQFDINYLSKGMYLLQLSSENKKYHSSFIKQ